MGRIREFLKSHSMAVGFALGSLTAGTLSGVYALHLTVRRLENVLDPSVTSLKRQAQYIYVENPGSDEYPEKPPWEQKEWAMRRSLPFWSQWIEKRTKGLSWRLLEIISTSQDQHEKARAVKMLRTQKHLGDSDFQHLAQLCNSKTAAYLAREPKIDIRFFLAPPKRKESCDQNCLLDRFHDLFVELKKKSNHWCLRYFVSKMFRHSNWFRELEYFVFEFVTSPLEIDNENAVKMCVESLLHHVMIEDNIHAMVEARGLEVLLDACRLVPDSLDLKVMAVKILMRVSSDNRYLRDIHVTGWMRMLVEWSNEDDQRLSAPAASALAYLDESSELGGSHYKSEVCLLHPLHREEIAPDVDVVLVHGLLGSVHSTWRQRIWDMPSNLGIHGMVVYDIEEARACGLPMEEPIGESIDPNERSVEDDFEFVLADIPESECEPVLTDKYTITFSDYCEPTNSKCVQISQCWPKDWLPKDHSRIKILGVDYLSRISNWTNWCPFRHSEEKAKLSERSKAIMEQLMDCGVGHRPIIWIGHSMGGLIIKHILTHSSELHTAEHERLIRNSKHVFFLGTPHLGSPIASLRKYLVPFLPSVETQELEFNSPELLRLHLKFCNLVQSFRIKVATFLETKSTKLSVPPLELELSCVAPMPADVGTGAIYNIPVGHMDIAKLSTRMSFIYVKILDAIREATGPDFDLSGSGGDPKESSQISGSSNEDDTIKDGATQKDKNLSNFIGEASNSSEDVSHSSRSNDPKTVSETTDDYEKEPTEESELEKTTEQINFTSEDTTQKTDTQNGGNLKPMDDPTDCDDQCKDMEFRRSSTT